MAMALSACGSEAPLDCAKADAAFSACFDENAHRSLDERFETCILHSRQLLLSGVWVTDFEWNQFHEDVDRSQKGGWDESHLRFGENLPQLAGPGLRDVDTGDGAAITRNTFVGRRRLCDPYPDFDRLTVDRVVSWQVLARGEEGAITYGPNASQARSAP
ncbi:hypothetical protein [Aurantiacibacter spongiae]|uniref:Uncharacterized protein n=1 Tax=Aurantiacibacter spongiae TaxID=2488860 RepID=A0A3N5DQ36_9SPHN|nr:hypothetical protein [Aurantiacibacter spongiae]RPF71261.1 hypothetical protein EG799_06295 [Aurantiacibacter spongiae]